MMDRYELDKLRDLPVEGVAQRLGLQVGRGHRCLCPFHDDHHASLSFDVRRNRWKCWSCDASGGTIDLVMKYLHVDFKEALRWLGDGGAILTGGAPRTPSVQGLKKPFDASRYVRFFEHPFLGEQACHFLFVERRLDRGVVSWLRLNSYGEWLQIPYYGKEGTLIGLQSRYMGTDKNQPRFRFPRGGRCPVYNLPVLGWLKEGEPLWIAEGASDCWSLLSSGRKAIAIPSATLLQPKDIEVLETLNHTLGTPFHMAPDQDEPGERLFLQLHELLPGIVHHQLPPGYKDFSCYYVACMQKGGVNHG